MNKLITLDILNYFLSKLNIKKQDKVDNTLITTNKTIVGAINEVKQSGVDAKNKIVTSINAKNTVADVTENDTWDTLSSRINDIVEPSGTVSASEVLSGKTFSNSNGSGIGTMTNNGTVSQSLNASENYTIPAGYHNGNGKVTANSLSSQTNATASSSSILSGETAWVNGSKITGNITVWNPNTNAATYDAAQKRLVMAFPPCYMPDGTAYYQPSGDVLIPENIKSGVTIASGLTGTFAGDSTPLKLTKTKVSLTIPHPDREPAKYPYTLYYDIPKANWIVVSVEIKMSSSYMYGIVNGYKYIERYPSSTTTQTVGNSTITYKTKYASDEAIIPELSQGANGQQLKIVVKRPDVLNIMSYGCSVLIISEDNPSF